MSHNQLSVFFLLIVYSFSILGCKEYNQPDLIIQLSVIQISVKFHQFQWCTFVELFLFYWKRALTSIFSWQNSLSLCPASFCTPRPNMLVIPGISWLPTFSFHFFMMKRISFAAIGSWKTCSSSQNHSISSSLVPGSSPGGSREFEAGTASARIRKQLLN